MKYLGAVSLLIGCGTFLVHGQLQLQALHTTTSGNPAASIVQGNDGNFYGTLSNTVFKMSPAGAFGTVGPVPGVNPDLTLANDGNFYGTTKSGGVGYGTIFRFETTGQVTFMYSFTISDGKPLGLRAGVDGYLYGACLTSNSVGVSSVWSVFQFDTNGVFTVLRLITNTPGGHLIPEFSLPAQGPDGALYGSFSRGEAGFPGIDSIAFYRLSTSGSYQVITNLSTTSRSSSDLVFGSDGDLYGAAGFGSYPSTAGSVFKLSTNGTFRTLWTFGSTNGTNPEVRLLPGADGALYGTTSSGGTSNLGTIFRITTDGTFTHLFDFPGGSGSHPMAPLIQASDGNLYGTTEGATVPVTGTGIIFRLVQSPIINQLSVSNGAVTLSWNSFSNAAYRVEYKSSVFDPSWTILTSVTARDVTTSVFDNSPAADQRFYRVVLLP